MKKTAIAAFMIIYAVISWNLNADIREIPVASLRSESGLSLEQSIEIALANNRQVLIAREGMNYAEERLDEAGARRYPFFASTASYTRVDEVGEITMGPGVSGKTGSLNNARGEFSVKQPIYSGGRISAGIEAAFLGKAVQSYQNDDVTKRVIFLVKKAYYDVILNESIVNVNRKSEAVTRARLDDVRKLADHGQSSRYELLRMQVQVTNIQAMRIQSETNLQNARLVFLNALGLPLERFESLSLKDNFIVPAGDGNAAEHSTKLEDAFHNRTDLKIARLKIDMQRQSVILAGAEGKPSFNIVWNLGYEYPSRKEFLSQAWGDYWNLVAVASVPVFEWGRIKARIRQEESLLKQAEIAEMDIRERIKLEVRQAVSSLNDFIVLIDAQKENIKQAEEGLRLAEIGYKNGINTQLELMDTQMALDTASKNYIQSLYQYNIAKANLDLVTGRYSK
jgi:outer membrane protein TolC